MPTDPSAPPQQHTEQCSYWNCSTCEPESEEPCEQFTPGPCNCGLSASAPPLPTLRSEDEIALYYWPKTHGEPPAWFRAAISDAFDTGIAFAVRRRDGLVEAAKAEGR